MKIRIILFLCNFSLYVNILHSPTIILLNVSFSKLSKASASGGGKPPPDHPLQYQGLTHIKNIKIVWGQGKVRTVDVKVHIRYTTLDCTL